MTKEFSAGGIILKKIDKQVFILLVKNIDTTYSFPKGHREANETLIDTVLREVEEETGLDDVEVKEKIGWFERESIKRNKKKVKKRIDLFLVKLGKNTEKINTKLCKWFALEDAVGKLKYKQDAEFLKKHLSTFKK